MHKYIKIGGFGLLIWLIPFIISFFLFPLRDNNRILFESLMPVIVTLIVLLFSILYFIDLKENYISEAALLGIKWLFISIFLDLIMFLPETEWQMSLPEYIQDIGVTYLIILFIPIAFGVLLWKRKQ